MRYALTHPLTARLTPALAWSFLGALLILLLSQIPTTHTVNIGGFDTAYTQGFFDPEYDEQTPYLTGAQGGARWSGAASVLLFPQAGLPGEVGVRLRGWRAAGPPPQVTLLLNGVTEVDRFQASGEWEERWVTIRGGWLKASDFFITIRSETVRLPDGREVGVLVDRVVYRVGPGPIAPYPAQLAYAFAAGLLLWLLLRPLMPEPQGSAAIASALLGYAIVWLLLYRLPSLGYPLRTLPPITVLTLAGALIWREGPALAVRMPRLISLVAPVAVIAAWTVITLLVAEEHVTLSRPGVESDFRVFATRGTLAEIFRADGFYNLGYPLLLWLVRPLYNDNPFLAGRVLAALSGTVLLSAGYWLARAALPPGPALVALLTLALNGLVAQYSLYVGSDMPFAALMTLAFASLAATLTTNDPKPASLAALAGFCAGLAFLMRHPGLLLIPWGAIVLLLARRRRAEHRGAFQPLLAFVAAALLTILPQLVVNAVQTGDPLYNQQAKNIWLAVYGNTDWRRWEEAPNDVRLSEVILRDPARFLDNWRRNVIGYLGSGAEDTSEFGRAMQLRLLGWPANWLAVAGLLGWLLVLLRRIQDNGRSAVWMALLLFIAGYVALISAAFSLQRFFLPLAPIYAVAAAWCLWRLTSGGRRLLGATLALIVVLWGGYGAGARYVLAQQPPEEVAVVRMIEEVAAPGRLIAARLATWTPLAKYSAIAHRFVAWSPSAEAVSPGDLAAAQDAGAHYLLWEEAQGPPPLPNPETARVGATERYGLYRLGP